MSETTYPPFHETLRADLARYDQSYSFRNVLKTYLKDRNFRVITTLRLSQATANRGGLNKLWHPLAKLFHRWNTHNAACDLSWKTRIGPGFHITHGWGLVMSPGAVLGDHVTVFHGVTIGRKDIETDEGRKSLMPVVEDNTWIGPHALILGVKVGKGSIIGGGSVVTRDVKPHSVMGGNPARLIREKAPKSNVVTIPQEPEAAEDTA